MVEATTKKRIVHVSEFIFQIILTLFVLLILWQLFIGDYKVSAKRTWHIILCVFGLALCMAEGVQIYRKDSIVTFGDTREAKKNAHLFVMAFAFTCMTIGISLKISEKSTHFTSIHGKLGLSTWVITFVALVGGLFAYLSKRVSIIRPSIIKLIHIIVGLAAYSIGVATLVYGLEYLMGKNTRGWVALVVLLISFVTYSLIEPCKSLFNYIKGD